MTNLVLLPVIDKSNSNVGFGLLLIKWRHPNDKIWYLSVIFIEIIQSFQNHLFSLFLIIFKVYFWTGSPALPASEEGFQPMPSVTMRPADDSHLPTANTCISRLYIPLYSSRTILRHKLLIAIKTKHFGFVWISGLLIECMFKEKELHK